jgi:parallel beta-helix repeat protein
MRYRHLFSTLLLAALVAPAAHAERVITADTKLTADIVADDPTKPCVRIAASGVTLDLNGHKVISRDGKGVGIAIEPGLYDVTIRKGTVVGFETGIFLAEGATHSLRNLIALRNRGTGIHGTGTVKLAIVNCRSRENGGVGILLENCRNTTIEDCVTQDNADSGIVLGGGTQGTVVERNVSRYNVGAGIAVLGGAAQNTIRRNTSAQNDAFDLADGNGDCSGNTWFRNLFNTKNVACID